MENRIAWQQSRISEQAISKVPKGMKKDNPLISVIVPIYNVKQYMCQCIDSILAQDYMTLEIILVDDGSTDGSSDICDEYAKIDSRIKVIHKQNQGLSSARNAGLNVALGQYIGFVDSDDWIEPGMYSELISSINRYNSDIAICGYFRDYATSSIARHFKYDVCYTQSEALSKLIEGNDIHDYAVTKLYSTSLWNDIRYPIGRYFEDVLTTYKLFLKARKVSIVSSSLYHYRQRGGSIARGFNKRKLEFLRAVLEFYDDSRLLPYKRAIDFRVVKVKYTLLWELLMNGSESDLENCHNEAVDWYNAIRRNRYRIIKSNESAFFKSFAVFSVLSFNFTAKLFCVRKMFCRREQTF